MQVNPFIIKWYFSFLTNRTGYGLQDDLRFQIISTGAPQGCVSSPVLFTLYTNGCVRKTTNNYVVKFSDDTAILSLLYKDQEISSYHSDTEQLVECFDAHHLVPSYKRDFLRRLRLYGVSSKIMLLFYQAVLENVIRYEIHLWYGNLCS